MTSYKQNIKLSQRLEYGIFQFLDHFIGRGRINKVLGGRRKTLLDKLSKTLKVSGEGKTIEIERRSDLTKDEFKKFYFRKGVPVIIEGAAKEWNCVKNWSLDYFKNLYGDDEVVISKNVNSKVDFEFITLHDIIDSINQGQEKYYRFYPLLTRHPEHIKDFDTDWLKKRRSKFTMFEEFRVFMGGKGTGTPLHNENYSNLFIQAHGEKEWILYPPSCTPVVDPNTVKNTYRKAPNRPDRTVFDPFNPKYDSLNSTYKYIDCYRTVLKPGDILWVPPFYWHTVVNKTNSIGVGYRWFNPVQSFRSAPLYMFLDFCATNPTFFKSIKLIKEDVNVLLLAQAGKLDKYRNELEARKLSKKTSLQNG